MNKSEQIEQMQKEIDALVKELSDTKAREASANSAKDIWYKAYVLCGRSPATQHAIGCASRGYTKTR